MSPPGAGARPVDSIFDTIKQLHASGTTILLVEQNARMALPAAGRGSVLQTGVILLSDTAENLKQNEMVRKAYMGET
jgi:branched-chain amino acid transport system ATP-binding protein